MIDPIKTNIGYYPGKDLVQYEESTCQTCPQSSKGFTEVVSCAYAPGFWLIPNGLLPMNVPSGP